MMKRISLLLFIVVATMSASAQQQSPSKDTLPDQHKELLVLDAACGQCLFQMEGKDCELAVRLNGKTYFVDGTHIDAHGDAHAENGFCNAIRKAKVQGEVVNNRFKATYFQLLQPQKKKAKSN